MKIIQAFMLLSILVILISCSADENNGPAPLITISEPLENSSYSFLDTVFVKAFISHDKSISYIKVSILNNDATPVLPVQLFYPETNEYYLKTALIFDNLLTESGHYTIQVKAESGGEVSNEWARINYTSAPKVLEYVVVVTKGASNSFHVFDVGDDNLVLERFSFSGDYAGSAISSRNQLFFTMGSVFNDLSAWELSTKKLRWSVPAVVNPPIPYFTGIYSDDNEVFVSTREAFIYGYDETGLNTFRSEKFTNGIFTSFIRHKNWLTAIFKPYNSPLKELVVLNYPGGTVFQSLQFDGEVAAIADYGNLGLLVFINKDSDAVVYHYQFDSNTLVKLKEFPQGIIYSLYMSDFQNAYIAFADGVYWYRPETGSAVKIIPVQDVSDIAYDSVSEMLFVSHFNKLDVYRMPSAQLVETSTFTDDILDIHLHYNK